MPTSDRPPVVVLPRSQWRGVIAAALLLSIAAVIGTTVSAVNALDAHTGQQAIEHELDAQRDQNAQLNLELQCRYVLSASRDRVQSDIFVTVALALSAAARQEAQAVGIYTARLDVLAADLEDANERRAAAISICETEPENVLG